MPTFGYIFMSLFFTHQTISDGISYPYRACYESFHHKVKGDFPNTSVGVTGQHWGYWKYDTDLALTCLGWQKPPSWVTAWHTQTSSTLPTLSPLCGPRLFRELRPEPT